MGQRANWAKGVLIGLVLVVCLVVGFYSQPRNEDGSAFDTSAHTILDPAFEVYGWFVSEPLDHEETPFSEELPYYRVNDERISDMNALVSEVDKHFSPEISESLFASDRYVEIDGNLYVDCGFATPRAAAAFEPASITRELVSTLSESGDKIVYQSEVSYSMIGAEEEEDLLVYYDFIYEKINGKWFFTTFEYYE